MLELEAEEPAYEEEEYFDDEEGDGELLAELAEWRLVALDYSTIAQEARFFADHLPMLSGLFRLNVQESANEPYRQRFTVLEADEEWLAVMYLYVHRSPMENTAEYQLERCEEPHRSRCRVPGKVPQKRDGTTWKEPRVPPASFYAYPARMRGLAECHVDWTSAPDRYAVTLSERPITAWLRCFRFFAFSATKYHLLARSWPEDTAIAESYRLVPSQRYCPTEVGWYCLFAFYAFDGELAGANKYTVQTSYTMDNAPRIRVGVLPSEREEWEPDSLFFYAHDVPLTGTSRFHVQYRIRDGKDAECEQNRISLHEGDHEWIDKFHFYAYAAPTVDMQ